MPATPIPEKSHNATKVMLVDDSAVIRGLISRSLNKDPDISIVASAHNGEAAVKALDEASPDVIILDIEMPIMDGITALPLMLEKCPNAKVLICSTLSAKGADISLKAMSLGATECMVKPTSTSEIGGATDFLTRLTALVKSLGGKGRKNPASKPNFSPTGDFTLRPMPPKGSIRHEIVAIGSSTGGPQALFKVLAPLKDLRVPIVVTQHMPKTFTQILAQHIQQHTGLSATEGAQDMILEAGKVYVAPGGYHMEVVRNAQLKLSLNITDGPMENYCKPSVAPMMRSVINLFGNKVLGVMLTGMGNDGLESFRMLADKGGHVIAQDEDTSTVWGMPGAVAQAGLCTSVLPLSEIGPAICKIIIDN